MASWSRTQASYALSSCESELYAMGSAAVEVLGVHAFLVEQGLSKEPPVVWGDSSSALQLAHRQGTGRLKHVRLSALQSWVSTGRLRLQKVLSADNVADVLTKFGSESIHVRYLHHVKLGHTVPMPSLEGRVIDPCTFLISSHVNTALIMLCESQTINKQVIVPIHSGLVCVCYMGPPYFRPAPKCINIAKFGLRGHITCSFLGQPIFGHPLPNALLSPNSVTRGSNIIGPRDPYSWPFASMETTPSIGGKGVWVCSWAGLGCWAGLGGLAGVLAWWHGGRAMGFDQYVTIKTYV